MFIDIHELELHRIEFDQEFRPGAIELGEDVRQTKSLATRGRAELVKELQGGGKSVEDIRLVAKFSTGIEVACARCLEPVGYDLNRNFDLLYRPQGIDAGHEELSVTDAEAEIGYYSGDGLLLEDVLREQVLLSVPIKALCKEQCKGLCPQCGKNLNLETCSCVNHPADPRWQALEDLRNKLQ
jgi:uncharacterized protein